MSGVATAVATNERLDLDRLGAAVALLFVHGWRVSEVLGLAWADLDLEAAVATVSRASAYAGGIGMCSGRPGPRAPKAAII
jgi:integrase